MWYVSGRVQLYQWTNLKLYLFCFDYIESSETYRCVLEGAGVGFYWFPVEEETGIPGKNYRPWIGSHGSAGYRKKVREKSRECHNHKPQPFPDTKRKRKQTKPNKRKSNKRTKNTKISSLFPKRDNRTATRTEKNENKITQITKGKT